MNRAYRTSPILLGFEDLFLRFCLMPMLMESSTLCSCVCRAWFLARSGRIWLYSEPGLGLRVWLKSRFTG